jgi:hypothetical protein
VVGARPHDRQVYVGYWFWGRPSPYQLWEDIQQLHRRIKEDYAPTASEVRAAGEGAEGGRDRVGREGR